MAGVYIRLILHCQEGKGGSSGNDEDDLDVLEEERALKVIKTTFELNDTLFAEAELEETDEVHLWLGVRLATRLAFQTVLTCCQGKCHVIVQNPRGHILAKI